MALEGDDFLSQLQAMMGGGGIAGAASTALKFNPYTAAATTALGVIQSAVGFSKLNKLKNENPQYELTAGMKGSISDADARRGMGFTPEQTQAYQNRIARGNNTGYQRAVDMAPSMAGAITAGINFNNAQRQLDFAVKDAEMQARNIQRSDSLRKEGQNISNMNTNVKINNLARARQSFGQAAQTGINNAITGMTMLGSGAGKGNKTTAGTPQAENTNAMGLGEAGAKMFDTNYGATKGGTRGFGGMGKTNKSFNVPTPTVNMQTPNMDSEEDFSLQGIDTRFRPYENF